MARGLNLGPVAAAAAGVAGGPTATTSMAAAGGISISTRRSRTTTQYAVLLWNMQSIHMGMHTCQPALQAPCAAGSIPAFHAQSIAQLVASGCHRTPELALHMAFRHYFAGQMESVPGVDSTAEPSCTLT